MLTATSQKTCLPWGPHGVLSHIMFARLANQLGKTTPSIHSVVRDAGANARAVGLGRCGHLTRRS